MRGLLGQLSGGERRQAALVAGLLHARDQCRKDARSGRRLQRWRLFGVLVIRVAAAVLELLSAGTPEHLAFVVGLAVLGRVAGLCCRYRSA